MHVVLELLRGSWGNRIGALKFQVIPSDASFGVGLARNEKPLVRFADSQINGFVGVLLLGLRLTLLEVVEVERRILSTGIMKNRRPREVLPNRLFQLAKASHVGGNEDERVLVVAG